MAGKVRIIDFSAMEEPGFVGGVNVPREPVLMTKKQIRKRVRRRGKITGAEFDQLYKPLEEWDLEELARGRPRNKSGDFRGRGPAWITREMHERIMEQFHKIVRTEMNASTVTALAVVEAVMQDDRLDSRNRPLVGASTKLDAAKFLLEHVVGKPKVHVETDISVKLQGLLAHATVGPVDGVGREMLQADEPMALSQFAQAFGGADIIDAEEVDEDDDE